MPPYSAASLDGDEPVIQSQRRDSNSTKRHPVRHSQQQRQTRKSVNNSARPKHEGFPDGVEQASTKQARRKSQATTRPMSAKEPKTKPLSTKQLKSKPKSAKNATTKPLSTRQSTTKPLSTRQFTAKRQSVQHAVAKRQSAKQAMAKPQSTKHAMTKPQSAKQPATKPHSTKLAKVQPQSTNKLNGCSSMPELRKSQRFSGTKQNEKQGRKATREELLLRAKSNSERIKKRRSSSSQPKRVSFSTVEIRQYARCLGDNPSTYPDGPSLSIDWMYEPHGKTPVNKFERQRRGSRKDEESLLLDGDERERLLKRLSDCNDEEIEDNIRELEKARRQRTRSNLFRPFDNATLVVENCKHALKNRRRASA